VLQDIWKAGEQVLQVGLCISCWEGFVVQGEAGKL
jgi:hypothetical protein